MRKPVKSLSALRTRKLNLPPQLEEYYEEVVAPHWGHNGEDDVKGDLHHEGMNIWLYEECITHDTAMKFQIALQEAVAEARIIAVTYGVICPIRLHIHSNGGDLYSGLGIADAVAACKIPIHTYVEGCAASAASLIAICGAKRFISPSSHILIHQLSAGFAGTHEDFQEEMRNQNLLMDRLRKIYLERSKLTADALQGLLSTDLLLDAEQCLQFGLVDVIGTDQYDVVGL